jgi:hypothetical protein
MFVHKISQLLTLQLQHLQGQPIGMIRYSMQMVSYESQKSLVSFNFLSAIRYKI